MFKKNLLCGTLALAVINPLSAGTIVPATQQTVSQAVSDSAITAQIKALYAHSPLVKALSISVTTKEQKVHLRGNVSTDMEYERAIALAESVKGVKAVHADSLFVEKSHSPLSDTVITAKIKGSLLKENIFGNQDIEVLPVHVETKNAVVFLSGKVDHAKQITNIIKIADHVKGVKSVNSSLQLK